MPAPFPSPDAIARAELLTHERFVYDGESLEEALAPGSARRRALDAALAEVEAGNKTPSVNWRRQFSLLLGLERLLSEEEPHLVDGTVLSAHQVDALSGTLTALLAESQPANGSGANGVVPEDIEARGGPAVLDPVPDEEPAASAENGDGHDDDGEAVDDDGEPVGDDGEPVGEDGDLDVDLDDDEDEDEAPDDDEPEDEEPQDWQDEADEEDGPIEEQPEDPNAARRFWFEHATGAGKTVAALGFVEASRTGGVLILTHRRNLVDQFHGELRDRGYRDRIAGPLLDGQDAANGPVTVETYQWFVRNAGRISDAYSIVICDEAHTALGEKTSAAIRAWAGPIFVGMTATGALIARHVTDLFPTQTSRFDLAQAARRGVIAPLRCIRIPPGPGVRTIAKVPLRRGEVDTEFDQEMLAQLLDQTPFNLAIADLYKTRFNGVPGVVYAAGVKHAYNVAEAFRNLGIKAKAVSGETPKRELARVLADYESGKIDVLINAQLLAEGWNSPRATICMHLAPTASKRIYQQRVGRVTRRHPGKEAGIVVDFVHPATKHDDPVVTLHSLLDRDVYRGGAIVVGPVRRGRGRRVRVERRVLPVTPDAERRAEVFERELWRIAVEHLDYGEQHVWAALAGARVAPNGWRRAKAMLHFDRGGELKRRFLLTAVQRNRNAQLRLRALQEIAASRDAEAFDTAIDIMGTWPRDERREGVKIMLQALAERRIGRRDQANAWIWRMAEYTREVHEEYAVQRWPETKRLLGLLVNSSGSAHARNARRLVHASRKEDRRLSAALLAAALAHTPEAEEALRGARTRMARKPAALARELLRNFPKGRRSAKRRRRKGAATGPEANGAGEAQPTTLTTAETDELEVAADGGDDSADDSAEDDDREPKSRKADETRGEDEAESGDDEAPAAEERKPRTRRTRRKPPSAQPAAAAEAEPVAEAQTEAEPKPAPKRRTRAPRKKADPTAAESKTAAAAEAVEAAAAAAEAASEASGTETASEGTVDQIKPKRRTRARPAQDAEEAA
ncbi:MAG TPA: DEAD/DEAH box helicase family protein [Solirubrobacteraceae bacterium]|nr:DEAD/DEAH box helicase family protein [Solirubrobacteraceae bacterium]